MKDIGYVMAFGFGMVTIAAGIRKGLGRLR